MLAIFVLYITLYLAKIYDGEMIYNITQATTKIMIANFVTPSIANINPINNVMTENVLTTMKSDTTL